MLADEPTAHLDYIQVDGVLRLLRDLAQPGRVVVVATHDERLLPLADRVVELTPRAVGRGASARTSRARSPGEVLFEQGDPGDLVYVVESGDVEIFRVRDDGTDERVTDDRARRLLRRAGADVRAPALRRAPARSRTRGGHRLQPPRLPRAPQALRAT